MSTFWIIIIVVGATVGLGVLGAIGPWVTRKWEAWRRGTKKEEESWSRYMKVQWVFMVISLGLGGVIAWGAVYVGPIRSETPVGGGTILDPRLIPLTAEKPIYTRQFGNLDRYGRVTVLTRIAPAPTPSSSPETAGVPPPTTPQPASGSAVVTVHRSLDKGRGDEIRRLDSTSETWTQWEENDPKGDMSLFVEATSTPVTVELIIYLTPKP
jgi:hypothetical protein